MTRALRQQRLPILAVVACALMAAAIASIAYVAPVDANQGLSQKIFYFALIPVSLLAIRIANYFIHPTVFTTNGPQMSGRMFFAFCVSWAAMLALAASLYRVELAGKRLDSRLRELREVLAR